MKRYKGLIWLLGLMIGFSSCEMRDEILGKNELGENAGTLELNLTSVYNGVEMSRAGEVVDNGTTTGNFNEEDINVDGYTLVVTNTDTQEEVAKGLVSELKNADGKVLIPLNEGNYSVKAYNYDGANVSVSERPYFKGEQTFSVKKGISTNVGLNCKLSCIEMELGVTASFLESFNDDYSITVDNGDNANQVFNKDNLGKKYYFKTPGEKNSLNVSVKATSTEGNFVELVATVQKPADAEGGIANLADGDSFVINLTDEGSTDSYLSIGLTVDLTFTEVGETIEIPVENITYDGPSVPGGETDPEPGEGENTLTVTGIPATYNLTTTGTVPAIKVDMASENGIKSLIVAISSDNETFPGLLSSFDLLEPFDLCNLEERPTAKSSLITLGLITEDIYTQLHAGTLTSYTFEVTSLVALLPQTGLTGSHEFKLTISDGNETKEGALTVNVTE
ncbi:DUF4493 domain-containing protein [Bacteroides mediterraneensis]|nr:DUF4493 domain-containing protein [Bacteroides mediterraneensis]